jgi:hypothetical protein
VGTNTQKRRIPLAIMRKSGLAPRRMETLGVKSTEILFNKSKRKIKPSSKILPDIIGVFA